jgi:tRNA (guanine37-N1)-methyltransferase
LKINILTLFPGMFEGFLGESIIKKAISNNLLEINIINIRDYCFDKHKQADDTPFGGGAGMVLKPEPLFAALEDIDTEGLVIYTSPQGKTLTQELVNNYAYNHKELTIIAGHYEGIDERVIDEFVDEEISVGDYVLTGGELPAMIIADAVARIVPNVLGKKESYENDSFFNGLLDNPHYTRPAEFRGKKVPDVLLSGHHKNIDLWRKKESLKRTYLRRPDLLKNKELDKLEIKLLNEIIKEVEEQEKAKASAEKPIEEIKKEKN